MDSCRSKNQVPLPVLSRLNMHDATSVTQMSGEKGLLLYKPSNARTARNFQGFENARMQRTEKSKNKIKK